MKVILISGHAQHGKDSTAEYIKEQLEDKGKNVLIAHYGDLVKYVCKTFFGWNGVKNEVGRSILQRIGTDEIRRKSPNFWVGFIYDIVSIFPDEWDYILIPDTRFQNEVELFKNGNFETITVRVTRTNFESPLTKEQQNHKSETALDDYKFDYYILSDSGLKNLHKEIDIVLGEVII